MQFVLAILVALAQAAGPWVRCCCVPPQLAAAITTSQGQDAPDCPHCQPAESTVASCCHSPVGPEKPPHSPKAPDCCPFVGQSVDAISPTTTDAAADTAPSGVAIFSPDRVPEQHFTAPGTGTTELPFLTVKAKLYVHHVLRC